MKVTDFDRIVCITVDTRFPGWPLRARREVEAKGGECGLFLNGRDRVEEIGRGKYDRINGDVPPGFDGPAGAYHLMSAFLEVVRRADRDGIDTVLIVEDDLEFTADYDRVTDAIAVPGDWGLFYFGANHAWAPTEEAGPNLLRVHGSYTTHCVGVHRRAFSAILALGPDRPIDVLLGSVHESLPCYAAWPSVAVQVPGESTIHGGRADYSGWFASKGSNWQAAPPNPDGPTAPRPPTLLDKAVSFGKAVVKQVAAGNPMASDEVQAERERICLACPHVLNAGATCGLCGCRLALKRSLGTSECPEGKWLAVT